MKNRNRLLYISTFTGIIGGLLLPGDSPLLKEIPTWNLMIILYMNFLDKRVNTLLGGIRGQIKPILYITLCKLFLVPVVGYFITLYTFPSLSVSVLLLGGMSVGFIAPILAMAIGENGSDALILTTVTSLIVPLSLPLVTGLLLDQRMEIEAVDMFLRMAVVIFIPIAIAAVSGKWLKPATNLIIPHRRRVTAILIGVTNFAVFSSNAGFFRTNLSQVPAAIAGSLFIWLLFVILSLLFTLKANISLKANMLLSNSLCNQIISLVLATTFFAPFDIAVTTCYLFFYFIGIIPIKAILKQLRKAEKNR